MANLRILIVFSLIGLATIVMVFYSHPLVDRYSEQNQLASEISWLEKLDANQVSSQINYPGNENSEMRPAIEDQVMTEKPEDITTTIEHVTLSGWVGTEFGENVADETVVLYSPSQKVRYSVVSGVSGEYRFIGIKPGWDYILKVSPQGMFKNYTRTQLKLRSHQEVHNITLEATPLGILTGSIVDPYDRPVPGTEIFVTSVEKEYRTTNVVTDANGSFSVTDFPKGKFQVAIKGKQTLKATGLKFDSDVNVPVILIIDLGPYNIEGGIYDESGQTFDGTDVYLIWALHKNGVSIRSTRKVSANTSGEFRFTGLGPGKHELVVSAWRGDTFKQTIKQVVNVGVDSGELIVVIDTL